MHIPSSLSQILLNLPESFSEEVIKEVLAAIASGPDNYQVWMRQVQERMMTNHPVLFKELDELRHFEDGIRDEEWGDTVLFLYDLLDKECKKAGFVLPQGRAKTLEQYRIPILREVYGPTLDALKDEVTRKSDWFGKRVSDIKSTGLGSLVILAVVKMCLVFDFDAKFCFRRQSLARP